MRNHHRYSNVVGNYDEKIITDVKSEVIVFFNAITFNMEESGRREGRFREMEFYEEFYALLSRPLNSFMSSPIISDDERNELSFLRNSGLFNEPLDLCSLASITNSSLLLNLYSKLSNVKYTSCSIEQFFSNIKLTKTNKKGNLKHISLRNKLFYKYNKSIQIDLSQLKLNVKEEELIHYKIKKTTH